MSSKSASTFALFITALAEVALYMVLAIVVISIVEMFN